MLDILRSVWVPYSVPEGDSPIAEGGSEEVAVSPVFLYVGDAAGRLAVTKNGTKDFADSDLKLAVNGGIFFQTPERFFLNSNQSVNSVFDLRSSLRLCDVVS